MAEEAVVPEVVEEADAPEQLDMFNMSDEDFMAMDYVPATEESEAEIDLPEVASEEQDTAETVDLGTVDETEENEETHPEPGESSSESKSFSEPEETSTDEDLAGDEDSKEEVIDFESIGQKILSPFKANGKDMQVANAEEALTLMQMGANYNKKMATLKPHLKIVKVLENNGIDESTLNYLIDLSKKDPKAINKLVKDSGMDPLEMDSEEQSNYEPTQYSVTDEEFELTQAIDAIKENPTFSRTINVIGKEWDNASKQEIGRTPGLIQVIDDHMQSGVYDVISTELDRRKALGQMNGLNDLTAYRQVGDSIQAVGGFNHLFTGQQTQQEQKVNAPQPKRLQPKQQVEDPKLKEKRKAAGASKSSPTQKTNLKDFNPLGMSDEEFEKQFSSQLL